MVARGVAAVALGCNSSVVRRRLVRITRTFGTIRWVVLSLYMALVGWNLFRRDPTFDELQAWGIARASRTPLDLIYNTAYEGRFPLWHFMLWLGQRISTDLAALHVISFVLALILGALVLTLPTVAVPVRLALLAGAPMLVGLTTLSRDYAVMAILALAATRHIMRRSWTRTALLISLLALVNLFGLMTGIALGLVMVIRATESTEVGRARVRTVLTISALPIVAGVVSAIRIAPPADSSLWRSTWSSFRIGDAARTALDGWGAVLSPLDNLGLSRFGTLTVLALVVRLAMSADVAAQSGLVVFTIITTTNFIWGYFAGWWHAQQLWVGLVGLVLTSAVTSRRKVRGGHNAVLLVLAILQFAPHWTSVGDALWSRLPTSNVANASEDAARRCNQRCTIVADTDLPTATLVAAHLDREIVAANRAAPVRFATYDSEFRIRTTWSDVVASLRAHHPAIAVVGNAQQALFDDLPPPSLRVLARFDEPTSSHDAYLVVELVGDE